MRTRRHYSFADLRYLLRGIVADQLLGLALWVMPPSDKPLLATALKPYWREAIRRAEAAGTAHKPPAP